MAKKKIRDMTEEEKQNYCKSKKCSKCPCGIWPCKNKKYTICAFDLNESDYEVEVEE